MYSTTYKDTQNYTQKTCIKKINIKKTKTMVYENMHYG